MYGSMVINSNRNHKRAVRRQSRKSFLITAVLVLSIVTIVVFSLHKTAQAEDEVSLHKYYKTIVIQADDTLWSIAEDISSSCETSTSEIVSEIQSVNNIGNSIKAGMKLIVPYYAE